MTRLAWTWHTPGAVLALQGLPEGWRVRFYGRQAGFQPSGIRTLRQVHGRRWIEVGPDPPPGRPEADAWIVHRPGIEVGIQVADCLPGLLADPEVPVFALVHAGWRGTRAGILQAVLQRLRQLGARPERLWVAYGPAIRGCHYEVGPEFDAWFPGFVEHRNGRRYLDLFTVHRHHLVQVGVPESQILPPPFCTYEHPAWFYSYRRDGTPGRMWMTAGFAIP